MIDLAFTHGAFVGVVGLSTIMGHLSLNGVDKFRPGLVHNHIELGYRRYQ